MVVNVDSPSGVPRLAEPWFLAFNAEVEFRIAMTPEDLSLAGLDAIGKQWSWSGHRLSHSCAPASTFVTLP